MLKFLSVQSQHVHRRDCLDLCNVADGGDGTEYYRRRAEFCGLWTGSTLTVALAIWRSAAAQSKQSKGIGGDTVDFAQDRGSP